MESFSTALDPDAVARVRALANREPSPADADPCAHGDSQATEALKAQARRVIITDNHNTVTN